MKTSPHNSHRRSYPYKWYQVLLCFTIMFAGSFNLYSQCSSHILVSGVQNANLITASSVAEIPFTSGGSFCGLFVGTDLGIGTGGNNPADGWIDITLPVQSDIITINFSALSFGATFAEYIVISVDGVRIDLSTSNTTFTNLCGLAYISTAANNYSGLTGVIETSTVAGGGRMVLELDCTIEAGSVLRVENRQVTGGASSAQGFLANVEICTDSPTSVVICGEVLPVELLSFEARQSGDDVDLNWVTAIEKNNDYFDIQRSIDGRNYISVGQVNGNGTTDNSSYYNYLDLRASSLGPQILYYRLKQVDVDGLFKYSKTVAVSLEGNSSQAWLFPNPAGSDGVRLIAHDINMVEFLDMNGRVLRSTKHNRSSSVLLPTSGLAKGFYFLRINKEETIKLIVQ